MMNLISWKNAAVVMVCLLAAVQIPTPAIGVYVITTDYSVFGSIRHLEESFPTVVSADLASIPGDAMGREYDGLVYVVGRGGSNIIQIFDPGDGFNLVREFSLGSGLNLQDIAFTEAGIAYVSCYDDAVLLKVDLDHGLVLDSFSTASFADADGLPETAMMRYWDGRLFIACQLLDRGAWYAPTGPSAILVFDTNTNQWVDMDAGAAGVQPIMLQGSNPYTDLALVLDEGADAQLLVGCVGYYGVTDGGVEAVNLVTGQSEGFIVTEADLGGDLTRFIKGETGLFAIVADAGFNTGVKFIDGADGSISLVAQGAGFVYSDLVLVQGDLLFLADRTSTASGIRVFDALAFNQLTSAPVATGLPPSQFVADLTRDSNVSPVIPHLAGSLQVGHPFPNPCNPTSILPVSGPAGTSLTVRIIDMRGHSLRRENLTLDGNGQAEFRFTGIDRHGHKLPTGQYRIVLEGEQSWVMRPVTLIK